MSNVNHLAQLEGDARDVAEHCVRTWPDTVITDSRRDPHEQAQRMARNCTQERYMILGGGPRGIKGTYYPARAAQLCHGYSIAHLTATEAELVAAFSRLLDGLDPHELRQLSRHISPITQGAHAVDFAPGGPHDTERCAYLSAEATQRGGRFLTVEGGLERRHWQAKD